MLTSINHNLFLYTARGERSAPRRTYYQAGRGCSYHACFYFLLTTLIIKLVGASGGSERQRSRAWSVVDDRPYYILAGAT